jgi:dihydrodipicolinate synthase/N-acetylneuraminate lyase
MNYEPIDGIAVAALTPFYLETPKQEQRLVVEQPAPTKKRGRPSKTQKLQSGGSLEQTSSKIHLDKNAYESHLMRLYGAGVNTFILFGTTGEGKFVRLQEVQAGLQVAQDLHNKLKESERPIRFIGGIVRECGADILDMLALYSQTRCIDSILIAPKIGLTKPAEKKTSQGQIADFYKSMKDRTSKPILGYNIPQVTNVTITPQALIELAQEGYIVGIKDSAPQLTLLESAISQEIQYLQGNDRLQVEAYDELHKLGTKFPLAAISGASNVLHYLTQEQHILAANSDGKLVEANNLQSRLNESFAPLSQSPNYGAEAPILKGLVKKQDDSQFPLCVSPSLKMYDL